MKNLEIRIIGGEIYVPLYAVVELLKQANPIGSITQQQMTQAAQAAIGLGAGVGTQFVPPEQDYKGISR